VVGVLDVQHDTEDRFTPEDVRLKTILAAQVGSAIQNAQLFTQTQESLDLTENLYSASQRMAEAGNDLQQILAAVIESVPIPAVDRAILGLFEQDALGELEQVNVVANWYKHADLLPLPISTRLHKDDYPAIDLMLAATPLFLADAYQHEEIDPQTLALFKEQAMQGQAILPLWIGKRQLGVLILISQKAYQFKEQEIQPYMSLVRQMTVAIENRYLFAQAQARVQREQILREVTAKVRNSVDMETIMRTAAQELGQALQRPTFVTLKRANGIAPQSSLTPEEEAT
jgi:GAF domain-containing protein